MTHATDKNEDTQEITATVSPTRKIPTESSTAILSKAQKAKAKLQAENKAEATLQKMKQAKKARDAYSAYCNAYQTEEKTEDSEDSEGKKKLIFIFNGWTYQGYWDDKKPKARLLVKADISLLYTLVNETDEHNHKAKHRARITAKGMKRVFEFTPEDVAKQQNFEIKLLHYSKQSYFDSKGLFKSYMDFLLEGNTLQKRKVPRVRELQTTGYDAESNCFVYPKFAFTPEGQQVKLNAGGYFDTLNLAPTKHEDCLQSIETLDIREFIETLNAAFGVKGLLALGFYVSSLFSHNIFKSTSNYPFLSLFGSPSCGKSFLIKRLNQCFFTKKEGVPISKGVTFKGKLRMLSQKVSMVTVFIESTINSVKPGEIDSIVLPLYDRNSSQLRAKTTNDNQTHETPFEGTLAFVQNVEPFIMKAAKQRVVSFEFTYDKEKQAKTYSAFKKLKDYTPEQLAFIGASILKKRDFFEKHLVQRVQEVSDVFQNGDTENGTRDGRISSNHAICFAGFDIFCKAFDVATEALQDDVLAYALERATTKEATAQDETPYANEFFEALFVETQSTPNRLDNAGYRIIDGRIYLHLSTAVKYLGGRLDAALIRKEIESNDAKISMSQAVRYFSSGTENLRCIVLKDISQQFYNSEE